MLPVSLERAIVNPIKINTIKKNPMNEKDLKKDHLLHGQMVSADHYILRAPGRIYQKKAIQIHLICTQEDLFLIKNSIGYVIIKQQVVIKATETLKAKLILEREAQIQGLVGYHTDNGIFNASYFMEELWKKQQNIRFSGE